MILRSLVAFTVLGLSVAGAKSFDVTLPQAAKAGSVDLKSGKYSVVVDGSKVRFTDSATGKTTEAEATVASSDKKFQVTQVDTIQANGQNTIREIDLGGTTTKLQFGPTSSGAAAQ
jgi:hypothetical protein